ncbi:UPF0496 protein At2g18630 [Gossypium raimondii]|uniref:Uncharacterized protein n=1 Tax=Gossypium raimondii TaxID=29730 RepID=A0A0D2MI23_GOSRA|nr:UPF0496 protein At2g18630 [Gossypium raimondii]KJB17822.1 hypothetical protein B456_003G017300 [Gossypium raimondii]MBA0581729.1 hypothetical protein [Gossypium raimondii]
MASSSSSEPSLRKEGRPDSRSQAQSSWNRVAYSGIDTLQYRTDLVINSLPADSDFNSFAKDYFDNTKNTLELCTAIRDCLTRTQNNHEIIRLAVKCFDEEVGTDEKRSGKTLEELKRFKAAEEPFFEELRVLAGRVLRQQESLQRKFNARKGTLEKKLASLETWRRVSLAFFVVAFFSLLIFSVVAATKSVKHVITALGSALTVAIVPVGTWCNERWNRNKEKEKKKLKLTKTVFYAALTPIIRVLVDQLEVKFKSLSHSVDSVLTEGYALKVAIDKIKKDLKDVTDTIPDVLRRADDLGRETIMDWREILTRMMETL